MISGTVVIPFCTLIIPDFLNGTSPSFNACLCTTKFLCDFFKQFSTDNMAGIACRDRVKVSTRIIIV